MHTTDCTGVFEVMAEQVRPGLTNPARFKGPQQSADLIRRQPAHSIRARGQAPFTEAECMAAISTCFGRSRKDAWQPGASMYEPASTGVVPAANIYLQNAPRRVRLGEIFTIEPADRFWPGQRPSAPVDGQHTTLNRQMNFPRAATAERKS